MLFTRFCERSLKTAICYDAAMRYTVLQWNVWFKENIENVLGFLRAHPADVLCLQELTRGYAQQTQENTWEYLAHNLGYQCAAQEIPIITPEAQWSQANAILSRFPLTKKTALWINEPENDQGYDDQYRGYLEVEIEVAGQAVTIGTTHLSYTDRFHMTDRKRQEIERLIEAVSGKQHTYVLAGDLNAGPDSLTIQRLREHLRHTGPDFAQNTWTTKYFSYEGFEASTLDWRLDYVFASHDLKVRSAKTIPTDVSDHLPILVEFEV